MNAAILGAGAMGHVLAQTIEEHQGMSLSGIVEPRNGERIHDIEGQIGRAHV